MKSLTEQIAEQEKKKAQLEAKIKQLKARNAEAERKARTRRLIETGAIVESALHIELTDQDQRERFSVAINRYADVLLSAMNSIQPTHVSEDIDEQEPEYISLF